MVNKEEISALVDGETPESRVGHLITALEQEPELRHCWRHYHLIGAVLRGGGREEVKPCLCERVAKTLESEPVIFAPRALTPRMPALKWFTGLALAASVAAVAVLSVQTTPPQTVQFAAAPATNMAVQQARSNPPAAQTRLAANKPSTPKLHNYLTNHNEYVTSAGMQGMLPYARSAAFDPGE
ncbi:MAG: hypothetical protein C4528_08060 [Gammaproteobacteria bacterium]|nr:MAG: hypothetical protein C4528_08060 [Gammaproteobacteria bacterium]